MFSLFGFALFFLGGCPVLRQTSLTEFLDFILCGKTILVANTILRVFVLHPGIAPLGNDPEWFKITRFYPEMCLHGVNAQWVHSQGVIQKPLDQTFCWTIHSGSERLTKPQAHIWSSRPPSQLELAWWPRLEVEQLLPFQVWGQIGRGLSRVSYMAVGKK